MNTLCKCRTRSWIHVRMKNKLNLRAKQRQKMVVQDWRPGRFERSALWVSVAWKPELDIQRWMSSLNREWGNQRKSAGKGEPKREHGTWKQGTFQGVETDRSRAAYRCFQIPVRVVRFTSLKLRVVPVRSKWFSLKKPKKKFFLSDFVWFFDFAPVLEDDCEGVCCTWMSLFGSRWWVSFLFFRGERSWTVS